jgi:PAS domain S-box-containing protein
MYEVSTRSFLLLEAGCKSMGIAPAHLVEGTSLSLERLRQDDTRLDWDDFARLCVRAGELGGGPSGLVQIGRLGIQAPESRPFRAVAELFPSTAPIYRLGATWFAPMMIYNAVFAWSEPTAGEVHIAIDLPPPHAACAEFLHLIDGCLRALPRFIGLPEAAVRALITPRHGEYVVTLPRRQTLVERARRAARVLGAANAAIDELAATQRSLRESALSRERLVHDFRRVIDSIPDAVLVHRGGVIRYANPAILAMLGLEAPADLAGHHVIEFLHPEEPARAQVPFLGAGAHGEGGDLRLRHKDGRTVIVEATAVQPVEFDGPAMLISARDVTERKQTELKVVLTERMLSVGTLAAGVAHEINNPLSYVLANVRQVRRSLERLAPALPAAAQAELWAMLDDAREGAERVQTIVSDLAAFSRASDDDIGPVEVRQVMERALKLAGNEIRHRAKLVRDYQAAPPARANEVRLAQVFLNLLVNASQAIPIGMADEHEIKVAIWGDDDQVVIAVSDSGRGVPPELRARVFDPFFTTRPVGAGAGLGLSVCHGIVTALGGTIALDDRPGGGTICTVRLPADQRGEARAPAEAAPAPGLDRPGAHLLVVDDEPRVAAALVRALEGHEVTALRDARAALELLGSGAEFDVILCDLMMPELSGMAFYTAVKAQRPGLERRIVFMTGGAFTPAARAFLRSVENACLEKPFRVEQVLALIEKMR